MKLIFLLLALVALLIFASATLAGATPDYTLAPEVIASGGQASASANYSVVATVGQSLLDAGNSASYSACAGFWCEIISGYKVYLPIVLKNL